MSIKSLAQRVASKFGFRIVHANVVGLGFEDFRSLVESYELLLNLAPGRPSVAESELRPKLLAELLGVSIVEAYSIVQALAETMDVPGDVCEFGVAEGATSALIANEIRETSKTLHLFDSFEGFPAPTVEDQLKDDIMNLGSMEAYRGKMSCPEDMVIGRLAAAVFPKSRYAIHKGFIERTVYDQDMPQSVSFAYVDLDLYQPIKTALGYLHEVTAPGAMIFVDDYDWFSTGAKLAVDEFVTARNMQRGTYEVEVPDQRFGRFAILRRHR